MTNARRISLGPAEARALLQRLRKDEGTVFTAETCRLYFVDVDVLSTYVDGANGDILSEWSSLFSLTNRIDRDDRALVDEEAHEMADAIARSVSGFLLGRFREGRSIQRGQLWLTPEHSRELDSLVRAVLTTQAEPVGKWQQALYEQYLKLSVSGEASPREVSDRLEEIFLSLRQNAAVGKVARAYDVRRRFTSVLTQPAIFPPSDLGQAFLARCDTPSFNRRMQSVAEIVQVAMLERIRLAQHSLEYWPAIEYLAGLVFDAHDSNVRVADHVGRALGSEPLRALIPDSARDKAGWIRQSARIVAVQVSDVFAIARIVVLGELLQRNHSLALPFEWRVCLVTGSPKLEDLLSSLKDRDIGSNIEILHPLSVMRFDEFLRPLSEENGEDAPGDEYALALLGDPDTAAKGLDDQRFFKSLGSLLSKASAGYAYQHDRSLRQIHRLLRADSASHARIVRAVGNAVSSEYIQTYMQVNRMAQASRERLPSISLPWVNLPLPGIEISPADRFVRQIHHVPLEEGLQSRSPINAIGELLQSDRTGYTACVCAALGYLAMDREHLLSAEMAANTAARTAAIGRELTDLEKYVPEGNEALYLAAFISRMRVSPRVEHRRAALEWRDSHAHIMGRALERANQWCRSYDDLASRINDESGIPAIELIRLRYSVENSAAAVWCMMIDLLEGNVLDDGTTFDSLWNRDSEQLEHSLATVVSRIREFIRPTSNRKASGELGFIGAQLAVGIIQFWICERIREEDKGRPFRLSLKLEALVDDVRVLVPAHDSALLQGLNSIIDKHRSSPERRPRHAGRRRAVHYKVFAALDESRAGFLSNLELLSAGKALRDALVRMGDSGGQVAVLSPTIDLPTA